MAMMSEACFYFLLSVNILYSDAAWYVRELKQEYILFVVETEVRAEAYALYFYAIAYR